MLKLISDRISANLFLLFRLSIKSRFIYRFTDTVLLSDSVRYLFYVLQSALEESRAAELLPASKRDELIKSFRRLQHVLNQLMEDKRLPPRPSQTTVPTSSSSTSSSSTSSSTFASRNE